jgi:hypothetical protein
VPVVPTAVPAERSTQITEVPEAAGRANVTRSRPSRSSNRPSRIQALSLLRGLLPAATGWRRKIYGFSRSIRMIQERSPCPKSGFRLAVVTKPIPHSELFRILDLVLGFDPDADVSWVRILEEI